MSASQRTIRGKTKWVADYRVTEKGTVRRVRKICDSKREAKFLESEHLDHSDSSNKKTNYLKFKIKDCYMKFAEVQYDNIDTRKGVISKYNNYLADFYLDHNLSFIKKNTMEDLRIYINGIMDKDGNYITLTLKESIWEKNKTFIKWLIDTEKIPAYNYFVGLKRFCDLHKRHAKKTWENEHFTKFFSVIDDPVERAYFLGLFTLGVRKSELNNMKYKDIDIISKTFSISMQYINKSHGETKLKTDNSIRTVPITDMFLDMINVLKKDLESKGIPDVSNQYVFLNQKGNVITQETVRRHFKEYIKKSGVPDIRIHDLRGSFATRMISETGNLELVRQLLGHSDVRTTMAYITPSKRDFDKIRKLNEIEGLAIDSSQN